MRTVSTYEDRHTSRATLWFQTIGWVAIAWIVVFWRLGYPSLLDPDEAHYAELTREMMRAGQWLVPLLNGEPYIDKPVFFHWLQAGFVTLLGASELALRLPSALAAVALIAITRWAGTHLFSRAVGNLAALMFATLPLTFALSSVAVFDMLYVAFLFGGVSCMLVAAVEDRARLQYVGYGCVAMAVMTKGPVALLLVWLFFITAIVFSQQSRHVLGRLRWFRGFIFVGVAASPWFLWMAVRFGQRFVQDYVVAGNLWYFTNPTAFSTRNSTVSFYLRAFLAGFFPWGIVLIGSALDGLRSWRREPLSPQRTLLWLWVFVVLGFFSAAGFKVDYYIFPVAPAVCLLVAENWTRARCGHQPWTVASLAAVAIVFIVAGAIASVALFQINLGLGRSAALLPATFIIGGVVLGVQLFRHHGAAPPTIAAPLLTLLASYCLVVLIGFPILERSRPTAPIGRWISVHTPQDALIGELDLEDWRASIRYYADRRVVPLRGLDDARRFLQGPEPAYALMLDDDVQHLRRAGMTIQTLVRRPAIVGRSGRFLRRQIWGDLVLVRSAPTEPAPQP